MDFKDRFKGRTSTVTKDGVIDNLNAPSTNPVQKSFSNNQLSARSKAPTPLSYNDNQPSLTYQRNSIEQGLDNNRGLVPPVLPPHSYSKSPVSRNTVSNNPSRLPTGSVSVTPSKNPYFVANPFPSLDQMEKQYANYDHVAASYGRLEQQPYPVPGHVYQSLPNTQFNPNSFYNQHSQYKGNGPTEPTPKRENIERQANYGGFNPTQLAKKNFDTLSQQNKLKRGDEPPNLIPNNRYGEYQNHPGPVPVYNNTNFSYNPTPQMQMQMPIYNGQRDIHSNPSPHQQIYTNNPFGYYPPPHVSQFGRENPPFQGSPMNRQPPSSSPDPGKKASQIQSSTNYKPYNLQDYKDSKGKGSVKLGGLGANTNTEEWYTQKEKREKMLEFSQNVKMFNMQRLPVTETGFKPRKDNKEKERSRREVALEFAKNVPKPKLQQRRDSPSLRGDDEQPSQYLRAKRSDSDMPTHYAALEDLDTYEQRHNFYAAQLNKIKSDK